MKRGTLYTGIALIILGIVGHMYGDQYSYVSADGRLHDSALLPISALLLIVGIVLLFIFSIKFLVKVLKKNK